MGTLNAAQRKAIEHGDGPLLILAGAGSGKTRVITHRIQRLIQRGIKPDAIVAVSFTNKAANEMAERMVPLVGKGPAGKIRMSTFHSFGLAFIKEEKKAAGVEGRFVIFDQADSLGVIKEILREFYRSGAARKLDPMAILARISNWKSALMAPEDLGASEIEYDEVAREVYPEYLARLQVMHAFDFDDLVCTPVRVLRDHPKIRAKWQKRIVHLLIDEFQDTSAVQLEMVKLLANKKCNVCAVGDDDQSIYSWRGANVGNILEFEQHFPGTKLVKLETNYRSKAPILEVANAVIANSGGKRHPKKLSAARKGGDAVRMYTCESPAAEAKWVAREIGALGREGSRYDDVAILYRSNQQARLIEEELTAANIPFKLYGGQQFFERKEVKDAAAYLRLVVNPYDEISMRRVINYPARGVGAKSVQRIEAFAKGKKMPFVRGVASAAHVEGVPGNAKRALGELEATLKSARAQLKASGTLTAAAGRLIEQVGIRRALEQDAEGGPQGALRYQNIQHLLKWLENYERKVPSTRKSLQDFLQRVTLNRDEQEEDTSAAVTLSTLHAAKGLEFGNVFLIGCVEGQLPHSRLTDPKASEVSGADLDEERRLFYVGITRAKDRLYLSAAKRRMLRGQKVEVTRSRYLEEIPEEQLQAYEGAPAEQLDHDEIASLARAFLDKQKASRPAESPDGGDDTPPSPNPRSGLARR